MRKWLIRKLAGKRTIILNATLSDVRLRGQRESLISNCTFKNDYPVGV